MKRLLYAFVVIGLVFLCMPELYAQDILDITPTPPGNINTVINSDTLAGGVRAHPDRIYRLRRGAIYQVTEPMRINGPITIIANDSAGIRPPVLAPAILPDNSSIDHFFDLIGKGATAKMSNIWLLSQRADNNWLGWSDGIRTGADSVKLWLRNVIFEGFSNSGINQSYWLKADVRDCIFKNHQHTGAWFGGQPFMGGAPVVLDTVLFYNNSFLANNSYAFNIRGWTPLARFEHNTMVYSTVNPFLTRQATNIHINNNIFYAQHAMGGNPDHVINSWFLNYPDTGSSSMIQFRINDSTSYWMNLWWDVANNKPGVTTGPEVYVDETHHVTAQMVGDATTRVYEAKQNVWYLPTKLTDFYKAYNDTVATYDSVDVPVYQGAVTKMYLKRILYAPTYLTSFSKWAIKAVPAPGVQIDTIPISVDPGFPAVVTNHLDSLIAYIHQITTGTIGSNRWAFPTNTLYPPIWPLTENLTYTNASLLTAGTDGFPVGDLNWFPTQKQQWEQMISDVQILSPMPQEYSLSQNYPNPFNPSTMIEFALPKQAKVTLKVFNILGQEVATLVNTTLTAGSYKVDFNASSLAAGAYIYRLTADNFTRTSKMLLIK